MTKAVEELAFPGIRYRVTHRASVVSILGSQAPEVRSYGSSFSNKDRWTLRFLIHELCSWAKKNPNAKLTSKVLQQLVDSANRISAPKPEIIIAATPDELLPRVAMALVGGAYHEAWHTLYSHRTALQYQQIAEIVLPRWEKLKNWANLSGMLLEWSNVIEDIRIERNGNVRFGGTLPRMHDLQDFILEQERPQRESSSWTPLATLLATFRDAGLGYATDSAQVAFAFYKKVHPEVFDLVVQGQLRPILDEAITLSDKDSLGCLRLAMDVALVLDGLALNSKQETTEDPCPQCGAPPSKRITRPNVNTLQPMTLCLQCGHMETPQSKKPHPAPQGKEKHANVDENSYGEDNSDEDAWEDSDKDAWDDSDEEEENTWSDFDADVGEDEDVPESPSKRGGTPTDDESFKEKGKSGEASEDVSEGSTSEQGTAGDKEKDTKVDEGVESTPTEPSTEGGKQAAKQWSPERIAQVLLTLLSQGKKADLQDFSSAMESSLIEQSNRKQKALQRGEQIWNPYSLDQDTCYKVPPGDHAVAQVLLEETRAITAFLQARLRTILLALRVSETEHGHKRGVRLSARNLAATHVALRGKEYPNRAFTRHAEGLEESFSGAIILDQSGSMSGQQGWMARCLFAMAVPMDLLGFPLFIAGFQNGPHSYPSRDRRGIPYHRYESVRFHVFKEFDSPLRSALDRAVNLQTSGGTPMADGIQFGLQALQHRPETHRALFVITDGAPDNRHTPVINWQTRIARESGIPIIGVGVGAAASSVCSLFQDYIWAPEFSAIPNALVTKLSMLINPFDQRHQKPLRLGTQTWKAAR